MLAIHCILYSSVNNKRRDSIDLDSVDSLREQPSWVIKQLPIQWWMKKWASYSSRRKKLGHTQQQGKGISIAFGKEEIECANVNAVDRPIERFTKREGGCDQFNSTAWKDYKRCPCPGGTNLRKWKRDFFGDLSLLSNQSSFRWSPPWLPGKVLLRAYPRWQCHHRE